MLHERERRLSVASERQSIVSLPGSVFGALPVAMALPETPALLAGGGETSGFSVLVHRSSDPVEPGVATDRFVMGIDQDDLVVLVDAVLVHPVRVQDTEIAAPSPDTLLRRRFEGSSVFELVHSLVCGLSVYNTLLDRSLPASATDANPVDDEALFGLVA